MLSLSNCRCGSKAQYYCKKCGKILCGDHIIRTTSVYYCKQCDCEAYDTTCRICGNSTEYLRPDDLILCELCKTPTIVDGLVYHQELPQKIYNSIAGLQRKIAVVLTLTERYHELVNLVWNIRIAKIALFPEVEDELSLLRGKIDNFIGLVKKFIDDIFVKVNNRLASLHYLRSPNLSNLEPAEELIKYLNRNYYLLEESMQLRIDKIEEDFDKIHEKVSYLKYQYDYLKVINKLIPEDNEELISIIPRVWIKKNRRLPKKHLFILTNKNIYLLREKGLFDVNLKLKETLKLSRVRIKALSNSFLFGKTFKFSTHMAKYTLFGRNSAIVDLRTYFNLFSNYYEYSNCDLSIIRELKYYTLSVKDLRLSINKHLNNLKVSLLKQREIRKEIMERDSLEANIQQIMKKLSNIKRKIHNITQDRQNRYQSPKVVDNLLRKLMHEQSRLIDEIKNKRARIRRIDKLWGEENFDF